MPGARRARSHFLAASRADAGRPSRAAGRSPRGRRPRYFGLFRHDLRRRDAPPPGRRYAATSADRKYRPASVTEPWRHAALLAVMRAAIHIRGFLAMMMQWRSAFVIGFVTGAVMHVDDRE